MQKHRRIVLLALLVMLVGMFPVAQPATQVAAAPVDEVESDDAQQTTLSSTPITVSSIDEVESNDTAEEAQSLTAIGLERPVSAAIDVAGDNDWYQFEAVQGRTYVVEVYDVESGLNRARGRNCSYSYTGLALIVYDETVTLKASQCEPRGSGNAHSNVQFTADTTGVFYIRVFPNSSASNVSGAYYMRILPRHDEAGAAWNPTTFEPNNRAATAYEIFPGLNNALTSTIEERNVGYATSFVDIDWYRFSAVAGQAYVIELFDVDSGLTRDSGRNCSYTYSGLAIKLFDSELDEKVGRCKPAGSGNVHTIISFTAASSGYHYIQLYPNANTTRVYGNYSIRVLPKHDEPDAAWDSATFEPNNRAVNAFPIEVGRTATLVSTIEQRNVAFSTNFPDVDWFRFSAVAEQDYVVEVFNRVYAE